MAADRQLSVSEIKRILKPGGKAYLSLGAGPPFGFVGETEWETIIEEFRIEQGGSYHEKWAVVSLE